MLPKKTKSKPNRFAPTDTTLALRPSAFGGLFDEFDEAPVDMGNESTRVIRVRGPLMHRRGYWFDSYEGLKDRVAEAIEGGAKRVVMDIDSPGGLVSGAFDTARELRAMCVAADVELHAFVDAQAASAGYAIASAATKIGCTETAELGSIGVICPLISMAERNKMDGLTVRLVTSGERKGDGWPEVPTSEGAIAAKQKSVDSLAEMFFALVSEHGWVGSTDDVRAMQAGVVHGKEAVSIGLATEITTLERMVSGGDVASGEESEQEMTTKSISDARAALEAVAEGDNEEEAKVAKAALAAMDEDSKAEEPEEDEAEDMDEDEESEDSDEEPEAEDDEKDEESKSAASAHKIAALALAKAERVERKDAARAAREKMSKFLATRPDLGKDLRKQLSKLSLSEAKEIAATIPKGVSRVEAAAAEATVTGTQGAKSADAALALSPEEEAELDRKMGLGSETSSVVETPFGISFGVRVPAK